jgi:3-hydroxybutyryl-CoA dehydrogenase
MSTPQNSEGSTERDVTMKIEDITGITVVGAGTMGHGIAQVCAWAGYDTWLNDADANVLSRALDRVKANLFMLVENGVITRDDAEAIPLHIRTTSSLEEAARNADFVIEAVPEVMEIKKKLLQKLDRICADRAILASNTSSLSITELASATKRSEKIVGMHWWNPPPLIPLVEIFRGAKTSDETVEVTRALVLKLKKVPAVCLESPGYLGVRLQAALTIEAMKILAEGLASAEDVDAAVKNSFGLRLPVVGPLEVADLGGLDVFLKAYDYLYKITGDKKYETPELLKRKVEEGKLGVKTGEGFYKYTDASMKALASRRDTWLLKRLKEMSGK